jgi:mitogen-activated protein kinase kinase kinase 1
VVHRDIKPDNLMLSASGELKIVDFGTAKHLSATLSGSTGQRGTAAYMAPEIMKSEPCRTSCDIWSVGCTIVQMLTRKLPYSEAGKLEPLQLMLRIYLDKKGPLWPKEASCEELDNLLEQCFRADPLERPTAAQLLAHPFFSRNFEQ